MTDTGRSAHIDNTRLGLVFLVVLGHLAEPLIMASPSSVWRDIYHAIYLFHMPALVFLAGMNSRVPVKADKILYLLSALVIFQILYAAPLWFITGTYVTGIWQPYWILWFLASLIFWRAILPLFARARYPVVIAALIALTSGAVPAIGYDFSLSRSLVFLPFFVAGFRHGARVMQLAGKCVLPLRVLAVVFLAANAFLMMLAQIDSGWLYGSEGYDALSSGTAEGIMVRLIHLVWAALACFAFFVVMPRSENACTSAGGRTLPIYLWHGFFIIALRPLLEPLQAQAPDVAAAMVMTLAVFLTWSLSRAVISGLTDRLIRLPLAGKKAKNLTGRN